MAYYAYYRCSTETQMQNNGIQMQKDVVAKYCEENNIEIAESFVDEGISGTKVDRPGIVDLLSILEKGDIVIAQNTSRLWRGEFATAIIKKQFQKIGADIISIEYQNYSVNTAEPSEVFINRIMEAVDEYQRLEIAMKLSKGRKAKARKGSKACGAVPFGYKWENAKVVVDYNNNLIVQDIFRAYIEFNFKLSKLYNHCLEMGYKTASGKDFSKPTLQHMLSNDFYIGITTHAGKKVSGQHEAIISNNIFEMVQKKSRFVVA